MRLFIDAREFVEPRKTGIGRYLENLLVPLLDDRQLELVLFVNDPAMVPSSLRSVRCVTAPAGSTIFTDQFLLPRIVEREGCDVFFSPYYKVPLTGRFKRIITVHDIAFLRLAVGNQVKKWLQQIQLNRSTSVADVILVDSEFTRKDLMDLIPSIAGKMQVLYPSIEPSWAQPADPELVQGVRSKYAGDRPFMLYVGNFKRHKNVDLLVEAFGKLQVAGTVQGMRLVLAGGDPGNLQTIESLARSVGVGVEDIRICPNVSDVELKALYSSAEWFVTASQYEGFGYPLVEAMSCGCPVICNPCTSLPEITGGVHVSITDLSVQGIADALSRALSMPVDQRQKLIQEGRTSANRFLSDSSSRQFREIAKALSVK